MVFPANIRARRFSHEYAEYDVLFRETLDKERLRLVILFDGAFDNAKLSIAKTGTEPDPFKFDILPKDETPLGDEVRIKLSGELFKRFSRMDGKFRAHAEYDANWVKMFKEGMNCLMYRVRLSDIGNK